MNIGKKIKELRQKAGLTQQELAAKLGCSFQIISKWENNEAEPRSAQRKKLCEVFDISEAELFADLPAIIPKNLINVPILGTAPAGPKEWTQDEVEDWIPLPDKIVKNRRIYLIHAQGDSMIDAGIKPYSLVIVDADAQPVNGDIVVAKVDNEYTIKKFYQYGNTVVLRPANPKYKEQIYTKKNDIKLRGVVKGVLW